VGAALVRPTLVLGGSGGWEPLSFSYNVIGDWGFLFTGPAPAQAQAQVKPQQR